MDGVDFKICEPKPFQTKWYSHKFKGPGLRYEKGASRSTGIIVWTHGPLPCGSYPDVKIFRLGMRKALDTDEYVDADRGYGDEKFKGQNDMIDMHRDLHRVIRAGHETINSRMKSFLVLGHRFRHKLSLHSACFHAFEKLIQIMLENGEPLYEHYS